MIPTKGREYLLRQLTNLMIKEGLVYDPQPLSEGIDALTALNRLQSQIIDVAGDGGRLTELENKYLHYEVYELITTDTGTITKAEGSTILLDRYKDAGDAIVVKVDANDKPIDEAVQTDVGEVVVVTSFDTLGNYVLSRIPNSYPVAIVYQIKIPFKDSSNVVEASIINALYIDESVKHLTGTIFPDPVLYKEGDEFLYTPDMTLYKVYNNNDTNIWVQDKNTTFLGVQEFKVEEIIGTKTIEPTDGDKHFYTTAAADFNITLNSGLTKPISIEQDGAGIYNYIAGDGVTLLNDTKSPGEGKATTVIPRSTTVYSIIGGIA